MHITINSISIERNDNYALQICMRGFEPHRLQPFPFSFLTAISIDSLTEQGFKARSKYVDGECPDTTNSPSSYKDKYRTGTCLGACFGILQRELEGGVNRSKH